MEADPKHTAYETALYGVVDALHGVVSACEALAIARRAWDPGTKNANDATAHAAIRSCSARLMSILNDYTAAHVPQTRV